MDPSFDMTGIECVQCLAECEDIFYDDAACGGPYGDLADCASDAGCDELEDDEYDACVAAECCDEALAAF